MLSDLHRSALLADLHQAVAEAASGAMEIVAAGDRAALTYPPGAVFTPEEAAALGGLGMTADAQSALRKVVADACSAVVFRFFALADGVGDPASLPESEYWPGLALLPRSEEVGDGSEDDLMWHDAWFESAGRIPPSDA